MDDKPIIRHCRNCKYFIFHRYVNSGECDVTYKYLLDWEQGIKAKFCKYFKVKEEENKEV